MTGWAEVVAVLEAANARMDRMGYGPRPWWTAPAAEVSNAANTDPGPFTLGGDDR